MDDTPRPFLEHIVELRTRLLRGLIVFFGASGLCYYFSAEIFAFMARPLSALLASQNERRMIYTGLSEVFLTYIKVATFAGLFLSFPFIAQQLWAFIAPGLYREERKLFSGFLIATPLFFIGGAAFAYYVVFPQAYRFFLSFEMPGATGALPLILEARVEEYLAFVMRLVLAFGMAFELPILLTLLAFGGWITSYSLIQKWRLAVVLVFIVAAIVTPPDMFSMIALALPLLALYGLSILMIKVIERRRIKINPPLLLREPQPHA